MDKFNTKKTYLPPESADGINGGERYDGNSALNAEDMNKIVENIISLKNMIYPVGSIYMSANNTNPSTLFGGTWQEWGNGRVPIGINASDSDFSTVEKTGGYKGLQAHTHDQTAHRHNISHTHSTPDHTHTVSMSEATTNFDFTIKKTADWSTGPIVFDGNNIKIADGGYNRDGALDNGSNIVKQSQISYEQKHNHSLSLTSSGVGTTYASSTSLTNGGMADGSAKTGSTGNGATRDATNGNLPPYITCYMWKRIA